jgi:two-component system, OmpR family, response regulator
MKKKRILVVDDEAGFTSLLRLVLPLYEIREENDPKRAVATALDFQPDLILLDFIMPELDGGTLAARFGEEPLLRFVPIIFLTAILTGPEAESKTIDGHPCLAKPVSKERLVACINEHLPI